MASHVFVVDSGLKRTQIKVAPGKYLREVLEEACKSRKLDPESYTLKTQSNKVSSNVSSVPQQIPFCSRCTMHDALWLITY